MKINIILIAPVWKTLLPDATAITYEWAIQLKDYLTSLSENGTYQLKCFVKEDAVRKNVESYLQKDEGNQGFIIFLDHGTEKSLLGSDRSPMIGPDNAFLLKNKFIYSIACRSGSSLGRKAISMGACGFIGFSNDFQIIFKTKLTGDCTKTFGRCFLSGLKTLLEDQGRMWDAVEHIQDTTEKTMLKVLEVLSQKKKQRKNKITLKKRMINDALIINTSLKHNLNFLSPLGDPNWSISQWHETS